MRRRLLVFTLLLWLTPAALLAPSAALACDDCCEAAQGELAVVLFHLPLAFNDGTAVPMELIEDLLTDVTELAGGFTYEEGTGGWLHEGKLYREAVWVVKVGISEEKLCELQELVEGRLKGEFGQIAVWFEVAGSAEIL